MQILESIMQELIETGGYFEDFKKTKLKTKIFISSILLFLILLGIKIYFQYHDLSFGYFESIITIGLFILFIFPFVNSIQLLFISPYKKKYKLPAEHYDNYTIGVTSIGYVIKTVSIIISIFYVFNIELEVFLASLGLFSVALAWIFKEYIDNMLDGFVIIFSEDFKIRDYIKVGEIKGKIKHIRFQNIELKTDEGDIIYIPNSVVLEKPVINYSKTKIKTIDFEFNLPFALFDKIEEFEEFIVTEISQQFNEVLDPEKFYLKINKIRNNDVSVSFHIPVKKYNFTIEEKLKKFASVKTLEFIKKNS